MNKTHKATVTYLYADGHAVVVYEKQDKQAGLVEWVEVYEQWTKADCNFQGRIIIGRYTGAMAWLCSKQATLIRAKSPSIDYGSQGTKEKGIAVGLLEIETKEGSFYWHDMPGVMSAPYTYQPEQCENFDAGLARWAGRPVARIHRKAQAMQEAKQVA